VLAGLVGLAAALSVTGWFTFREVQVRVAIARPDSQLPDTGSQLMADQPTDSLIAELVVASRGRYAVIGNAASLRVARAQRDPQATAAALGARYFVVGQVQPGPQGDVVVASLLRMPQQTHIAVGRFPVGRGGLGQAETARRIAERFRKVLSAETTETTSSQVPATR
jgi:hypothetical protein